MEPRMGGTVTEQRAEPALREEAKQFLKDVVESLPRHIPAAVFDGMTPSDRAQSALSVAAQLLLLASDVEEIGQMGHSLGMGIASMIAGLGPAQPLGVYAAHGGFVEGVTNGLSILNGTHMPTAGSA